MCQDDRARGLIQFYGANRTGRWAGRLIQVQNLPQNKFKDLELARDFLKAGEFEAFKLLYSDIPKTLSQLIRTAFIANDHQTFYVADFSAIEARVIAWLANESWRMDVFNTHGKIYEASAAQMFNVPLETITKGGENYSLRAKGKVAELALGYGGSVGALESMGALNQGLTKDELKPLVDKWRAANPAITKLWWDVDKAAINCVKTGQPQQTHGLTFRVESGIMFLDLPSGRSLAYFEPGIGSGKFSKEQLVYSGTQEGRWCRIKSYGPKLVENIIQALARDCLCFALKNLYAAKYRTVMHVHDEAIIECVDTNQAETLKNIEDIMGRVPDWAQGLPLNADGYVNKLYKKDD
jgi:DNA polymerase